MRLDLRPRNLYSSCRHEDRNSTIAVDVRSDGGDDAFDVV